MNIDKNSILELLHSNGQHAEADQAASQLPDQVDTEQHAGLLSKLGLNIPSLIAKFTGGNAAGAGGLGGMLGGVGGGGLGGMLGGLAGGGEQPAEQAQQSGTGSGQSAGNQESGEPESGGGLSGLLGRL